MAAAAASTPRVPALYAGDLPQFSSEAGFLAEDFPFLVLATSGAAAPVSDEMMTRWRQ